MPMPRFFRGGPASASALNAMAQEIDYQGLACKVRVTAPGNMANNTDYILNWQIEEYDTFGGGMWSFSARAYVQIRVAGVYLMRSQLRFPVFGAGACAGKILINSTNVFSGDPLAGPITSDKQSFSTVGEGVTLNMVAVEPLQVGDRIYVNAWQSSGGTLSALLQDYGGTYLAVNRLSALI